MKTTKEAAREHIDKINHKPIIDDVIRGFIAGAKFAQRWISIEDELPEDTQEILMKNVDWENVNYPEGVRSGWYNPTHCKYYTSLWDDNKEEYITSVSTPTHWRPIELK